jgi:cytochrome c1
MGRGPTLAGVAVLAVLIAGGGYVANQVQARRHLVARVQALTGGDPDRGRAAIQRRPCGGCHEIPGVAGAQGHVAAPLTHFAGRAFIAGHVDNNPANLVQWIEDPHTIDKSNAMPPMGIGEAEARDIAAYLYTLS